MNRRILVLLALATLPCACGRRDAPKSSPPPQKVVVAQVVQRDEPLFHEWIGTTQGDVNADIRPRVEGYLLRRIYAEGGFVRQGDLLFEIDPRQLEAQLRQAEANVEQAKASLDKAERDVVRDEPLAAQRAISQQELDNARSSRKGAAATVGALQAAVEQTRLNLSWTKVTSPIDGIAGIAPQQVGDLVGPQTVLTTVSKVDPIRVLYQLSEKEYVQLLRDPEMRNAELTLVLADGELYPRKGRVLLTGREVDVKTGTIAAIGLFPNPGNALRPGQYAKVRAVVKVRKGALLVPQRAVNEMQGAFHVGVVGPGNVAEIRKVKPAERSGSLWIVEEGLRPGETVIVEGFSKVRSGVPVSPVPVVSAPEPTPPLSTTAGR